MLELILLGAQVKEHDSADPDLTLRKIIVDSLRSFKMVYTHNITSARIVRAYNLPAVRIGIKHININPIPLSTLKNSRQQIREPNGIKLY